MNLRYLSICLFILLGYTRASGQLVYEDHQYDKGIRTVQLYPDRGNNRDSGFPPVIAVGDANLVLEFDDLQSDRQNYYAKVLPCTYNWQPGTLNDLDFMHEYNEYNITEYAYSSNTQIPYVHYRFIVPSPKISGNFLLIIYRDGDRENLVISRRFMVYQPMVTLIPDRTGTGVGALRTTHQPLNFAVNYTGLQVFNPLEYLHVCMRQNQRWDNYLEDLQPSFYRENESLLEFKSMDPDHHFAGGNEFRFVDFRSLNFPGQNVGSLDKTVRPPHLIVAWDKPRTDDAYAQYNDMNGGYFVDNQDYGEPRTTGQYVNATFTLKAPELTGKVYVSGAFNQWQRNSDTEMVRNADGTWYYSTLLKQGFYNYQYSLAAKGQPAWAIEGSHFETENVYEVMVYVKSLQPATDLLVGYFVLPVNQR